MARWLAGLILAIAAVGTVGQADTTHYGAPASIRVQVPVGATLTIDGTRTQQMTAMRQFVSPPLPHGKRYIYHFHATYTWFGEPVARKQEVEVWANAVIDVDMQKSIPIAPPAPPPELPPDSQWTKPAAPNPDVPKRVPPKPELPKKDPPKIEIPKVDPPKIEPPKVDPPKPAAPANASPKAKPPVVQKPEIEVPYVPTPITVVNTMLKLAEVKATDIVFDLGCGDGRIPITAVKQYQARKGIGIDFNPIRIEESLANAKKEGEAVAAKLEFRTGDVLKLSEKDFADVDVVTLYLLPEVNIKLRPLLQKGLKAGARVVSHDFDMGEDWMPDETRMVLDEEGIEHVVYLWKIKKP